MSVSISYPISCLILSTSSDCSSERGTLSEAFSDCCSLSAWVAIASLVNEEFYGGASLIFSGKSSAGKSILSEESKSNVLSILLFFMSWSSSISPRRFSSGTLYGSQARAVISFRLSWRSSPEAVKDASVFVQSSSDGVVRALAK